MFLRFYFTYKLLERSAFMKKRHNQSFSLYFKTIIGQKPTKSWLYLVIFLVFYSFQRKKVCIYISNVLKWNIFWNEVQQKKFEASIVLVSFFMFYYSLFFYLFFVSETSVNIFPVFSPNKMQFLVNLRSFFHAKL